MADRLLAQMVSYYWIVQTEGVSTYVGRLCRSFSRHRNKAKPLLCGIFICYRCRWLDYFYYSVLDGSAL